MSLLTYKHNTSDKLNPSACMCYGKAGGICHAASDDIVYLLKSCAFILTIQAQVIIGQNKAIHNRFFAVNSLMINCERRETG